MFQSNISPFLGDDVVAVGVGCPDVFRGSEVVLVGEETVDACLTSCLEDISKAEGLLIVLLLRCVALGSCGRCWDCVAVWYEHGVVNDGCNRQPIAAVRSESSVRNIILSCDVVLARRS